jgi:hypothetical protein
MRGIDHQLIRLAALGSQRGKDLVDTPGYLQRMNRL